MILITDKSCFNNSALTLEHLEDAFYQKGFATFGDDQLLSLGISQVQLEDLKSIGATESQHVSFLQSAIAQAGIAPVRRCEYDFSAALADPGTMLATAAVLENIGVSAYLGAAPLLSDPAILGAAGSILTVEARHQSAIRVFSQSKAVPAAFDAALGVRAVFSLAAPFFVSCPEGSNLVLEAFPTLALADPATDVASIAASNSKLRLASDVAGQATHCAFTAGGASAGGAVFSPFTEGEGCDIPKTVAGVAYLTLVNSAPLSGVVTDDITVSGPTVVTVS